MTAPSLAPPEPPDTRAATTDRRDRWIAGILLVVAFLFALIGQTLLFHRSSAMGGDIDYHRGVGLTMTAGAWQGEGPVHGLLAYFGGLYPMIFGWGSKALGVSFDSLLSVVSWPMVLALPLALLWLGRTLWPGRTLEPAVLVFLGTVGSSLAQDESAEWGKSLLLSGANIWPTLPRDIALVLLVCSFAIVVGGASRTRSALAGLIAGVAICFHAQLGLYVLAVLIAYRLWQAVPTRAVRRFLEAAAIIGGIALVTSAWWWWARVDILLRTQTLVLKSYPAGLTSADTSFTGLVNALGVVGLLAIPGVVLAFRRGDTERFAAVWLLVFVPFALLGGQIGDLGVLTGRRVLLLGALPLVICAAESGIALLRKGPATIVLPVLLLAIVIPSAFEVRTTRERVSEGWVPDPRDVAWPPIYEELRASVLDHGLQTVISPDADGIGIWEQTGAQPFSFWPRGVTKLGFDIGQVTPYSYKQRVRMQDAANARGLPGICALARRVDARSIVLFRDADLLATHDIHPAARFRVDPADRTSATIRRKVAPATTYVDLNGSDNLELSKGAEIVLDWDAPGIEHLEVQRRKWVAGDGTVELVKPDGTVIEPTPGGLSVLVFPTPGGITAGTKLVFRAPTSVLRVSGFERVPGFTSTTRGPTLFRRDALCDARQARTG